MATNVTEFLTVRRLAYAGQVLTYISSALSYSPIFEYGKQGPSRTWATVNCAFKMTDENVTVVTVTIPKPDAPWTTPLQLQWGKTSADIAAFQNPGYLPAVVTAISFLKSQHLKPFDRPIPAQYFTALALAKWMQFATAVATQLGKTNQIAVTVTWAEPAVFLDPGAVLPVVHVDDANNTWTLTMSMVPGAGNAALLSVDVETENGTGFSANYPTRSRITTAAMVVAAVQRAIKG